MDDWYEHPFIRRRSVRWRGRRHVVVTVTVLLASKPITMVREVGGAFHVRLLQTAANGEPVSVGMKFVSAKGLRIKHVKR